MINELLNIFFRFVLIVGVQVTVLNNIQLSGFINPYLYILFVLTLPVKYSRIGVLFIAFAAGLAVDVFSNTTGLHAAASVMAGFARPYVLSFFAPRDGYESEAVPGIRDFGIKWFLVYASTLVLIHHFVLFYLEIFRLSEFFSTFLRVLLSSTLTLLLVIIAQFLFGKPKSDR